MKRLLLEKKDYIKYVALFFLLFSFSYMVIFAFFEANILSQKRTELEENETRIISLERDMLSGAFSTVLSDLLYLSQTIDLNNMVSSSYSETAQQWLTFVEMKKVYGQILFVDYKGNPMINVNRSDAGNYISNGAALLDDEKACYEEASSLEMGQVYISKMDFEDFDAEKDGKGKETGPSIRFATPLYNYAEGDMQGVVIINFYPQSILDLFKVVSRTSAADVYLLNASGEWVANNDEHKELAFKYPEKKFVSFKDDYPAEWEYMQNNDTGIITTENGYFNFTHVMKPTNNLARLNEVKVVLENGDWIAVSFISKENANNIYFEGNPIITIIKSFDGQIGYFILILAISIITAMFFVRNKRSKEEVKYFSEYDGMTNVLNRRAGFERLHDIYEKMKKSEGKMCICFADINGLKEVNDALGHKAGDELIKTVVGGMEKGIRQSDLIVRLGGDEFLLVLLHADAAEAEQVWSRVETEYAKINEEENRRYLVSVSHGIEECNFEKGDRIDVVIHLADEKMYKEKRRMKKNLKTVHA